MCARAQPEKCRRLKCAVLSPVHGCKTVHHLNQHSLRRLGQKKKVTVRFRFRLSFLSRKRVTVRFVLHFLHQQSLLHLHLLARAWQAYRVAADEFLLSAAQWQSIAGQRLVR